MMPTDRPGDLFDRLRENILAKISLGEDEFRAGAAYFTPRNIARRAFLLQAGEVCRDIAFVCQGCLRYYTIDEKGSEHVIQFAIEGWWIADLYSYHAEAPSDGYIDALEDSELLLLSRENLENLCLSIPAFERFFRLLIQNSFVAYRKRVAESLSNSAEVRYLTFLETYPELVHRLPQHQIASWLGITPEALSRIRNKIARRK